MDDAKQGTEAGPPERSIAIGTWNMDYWKRTSQERRDAWAYLRSEAGADVMLLQETVVPPDANRSTLVHREIAGSRPWGSAVVAFSANAQVREIGSVRTRYGSTRFAMLGTHPGAVIVAQVDVPEVGAITCVSVYGLIHTLYAQTTMFRIVADLIPMFDSVHGERVVLGGDFNVSTCSKDTPELPRYRAVLDAVESLGLVNLATLDIDRSGGITGCRCAEPNCRHLHTFGGNPGTQLDWLYATPELARRCIRVRVDHSVFQRLSDHAPIIAEFRLSPPVNERVVDPESFITALGGRCGADMARLAENLVDWALRKHREMERNGLRFGSFDRLPTASGETPELWFQLDVKHEGGLQYTFSLRADGQVVIQFQHMSDPFETVEGDVPSPVETRRRLVTPVSHVISVSAASVGSSDRIGGSRNGDLLSARV